MPKIIDDVKPKILSRAKEVLLKEGYNALTIRSIAKFCNVAIGTVYNYFPSKEVLVAEVMLEDWQLALEHMRNAISTVPDIKSGIYNIYESINKFASLYRQPWDQYTIRPGKQSEFHLRQKMLRTQIAEIAAALLERFDVTYDPFLPEFTSQVLIMLGSEQDFDFSKLDKIIDKLYK